MTDHEGIEESKYPKLPKVENDIETLIEDTDKALRIFMIAAPVIAVSIIVIVFFGYF